MNAQMVIVSTLAAVVGWGLASKLIAQKMPAWYFILLLAVFLIVSHHDKLFSA